MYSFLLLAVCLIGLFFQLERISERYFKFTTRSEVHMLSPYAITVPMVSVCWLLKDVIDFDQYPTLFEPNFKDTKDMNKYYEQLDKLTVQQVFDASPSNISTLTRDGGCSIRLADKFVANYPYPSAEECYQMFQIKRYIQRYFMCYQFRPTVIGKNEVLDIAQYSLSPQAPGVIYQLVLNKSIFGDVSRYTASAQHDKNSILHDLGWSLMKFYDRDKTSNKSYMNIEIMYNEFQVRRMRWPYDTNCMSCKPYNSCPDANAEKLRNDVTSEMNKVLTFSPIFDETLQFPLLTAKHLRNDSFRANFMKLLEKCNVADTTCNLDYYVTKVSTSYGSDLTVTLYWPQDSQVSMKFLPTYDPIDFILYICSSFGIWLGVSVLSIGQDSKILVEKLLNRKLPNHNGNPTVTSLSRQSNQLSSILRILKMQTISHKKLTRQVKIQAQIIQRIERMIGTSIVSNDNFAS